MAVQVIYDRARSVACMYCTTVDVAFGPVAIGEDRCGRDPEEQMSAFLEWLVTDPRTLSERELTSKWVDFQFVQLANDEGEGEP